MGVAVHRSNVAAQRVRVVNRLHALFRDLIPGGAPVALTAAVASALLRTVRPVGAVEDTRKGLAQDMVRELRLIDTNLAAIEQRMSDALVQSGSRLRSVDGIGPVLAVRLIGRTGPASRFVSSDAFATYTGVAPIEIASGDKQRHRLSRRGDRQLNAAIHLVAVTQVRMARSRGRAYFDKKIDDGKTRNEAMRCLKRRLASHIWRLMIADEQRHHTNIKTPKIAA
jgi:transposase